MRRSLVARVVRPPILGLLLGGIASSAAVGVVLGATAVAQTPQVAPRAVLEATHLPPLLLAPGEGGTLVFDVHCAQAGVVDPEQSCQLSGTLFVRPGSTGPYRELPLAEDDAGGLTRLVATVPGDVVEGRDGFEYYAEIAAGGSGDHIRVPNGVGATYRSYPMGRAVRVDLGSQRFDSVRHGSPVATAGWGDGSDEVGLESGRSADPIGATSFDVDRSGDIVLLDDAHQRVLRFARGSRATEAIPLAIDGRLADLAVGDDGSLDVLESVAPPGRGALVRRFDHTGRRLDVVETPESSPSQIRLGPDGPVVLEHPSHLWMPVTVGGATLSPAEQARRGQVARPLRSGADVIELRTGNELRLALLTGGHVQRSWRLVSHDALGEIQLAEPLGNRLVVVVRVYNDDADEFRVLVLDATGLVEQFAVASADWAETAPLSRFRLVAGSLYQLGSTPSGAFVDRYDLEVR